MLTPITIEVQELTGEEAGGLESNLTFVFDETALPGADVNAPFVARQDLDDGLIKLSTVGTGQPADLQRLVGVTPPPPPPGKLQAVGQKAWFVVQPAVPSTIGGFSNGRTIFISDGS